MPERTVRPLGCGSSPDARNAASSTRSGAATMILVAQDDRILEVRDVARSASRGTRASAR